MLIEQFLTRKEDHGIFNNEDSSRAEIIGTSDALNSPRGSSISDGALEISTWPNFIDNLRGTGPDRRFLVIIDKRKARNGSASGEIYWP